LYTFHRVFGVLDSSLEEIVTWGKGILIFCFLNSSTIACMSFPLRVIQGIPALLLNQKSTLKLMEEASSVSGATIGSGSLSMGISSLLKALVIAF